MIRAVILDWGGVIMRTADPAPRLDWDRRLGLEPGKINDLVFASPEWACTLDGRMDEDGFWAAWGARLGFSPQTLQGIRRDFFAGDRLDASLVGIIRSLRPRFATGLLSNFGAHLRAELERLELLDAFDAIVISGQVGVTKPHPRIYQLAAEWLGVPPAECLFVDDFTENIMGARQAGMQTLHFYPVESAVAQLRALAQGEAA